MVKAKEIIADNRQLVIILICVDVEGWSDLFKIKFSNFKFGAKN